MTSCLISENLGRCIIFVKFWGYFAEIWIFYLDLFVFCVISHYIALYGCSFVTLRFLYLFFFFIIRKTIMGNALTTASVSAADVIAPLPQHITKPESHGTKGKQIEPPSECPMHKSGQFNTINYSSECPIDKMDESEINPLNMVCRMQDFFYQSTNMLSDHIAYSLLYSYMDECNFRCHQEINNLLQTNHFLYRLTGRFHRYLKQPGRRESFGYIPLNKCSGMLCWGRDGDGKTKISARKIWTI